MIAVALPPPLVPRSSPLPKQNMLPTSARRPTTSTTSSPTRRRLSWTPGSLRRAAPVGAVPPVPPPPVAPPPAQSNSPKCKEGHPMALKTATGRTQLVCDGDGCDKSIQLGDKWYSCVECDFDICESCVSSPVAPPTSPEPTRRRRSAASPTAPDSVERSIHSPGLNSPPAPDSTSRNRQSGPTRRRDRRSPTRRRDY